MHVSCVMIYKLNLHSSNKVIQHINVCTVKYPMRKLTRVCKSINQIQPYS